MKFRQIIPALLVAACVAPAAIASDVGLPQTLPSIPGITVPMPVPYDPTKGAYSEFDFDICDHIPKEYCEPVEIPKCKVGSPIFPGCIQFTAPFGSWADNYIPVGEIERVTSVTSGSAFDYGESAVVLAQGMVNTGGWSNIHLSPSVYFIPPADGIQDVTFSGTKPTGIVTMAFEKVEASLTLAKPEWLKGVRINAGSNSIVVMLDGKGINTAKAPGGEIPWPLNYKLIQ